MRVVLDTNILIRANPKARGPARELLEQIAFGEHVLVISHYLLLEIERVLAYPRVSTRWKLTAQEVEEYLQTLAAISQMVTPLSGGPIILKDVDDDPVILYSGGRKGGGALHPGCAFLRRGGPCFLPTERHRNRGRCPALECHSKFGEVVRLPASSASSTLASSSSRDSLADPSGMTIVTRSR